LRPRKVGQLIRRRAAGRGDAQQVEQRRRVCQPVAQVARWDAAELNAARVVLAERPGIHLPGAEEPAGIGRLFGRFDC